MMSLSENESQISIFNAESDLHQRRSVKSSGLALLGIVATIFIVVEHSEGLTIPTLDHFPSINAGRLAKVVLEDVAFAPLFCVAERRHN